MAELTLDVARKILDMALAKGVEKKLKPLVVTVLDVRGCVKISAAPAVSAILGPPAAISIFSLPLRASVAATLTANAAACGDCGLEKNSPTAARSTSRP